MTTTIKTKSLLDFKRHIHQLRHEYNKYGFAVVESKYSYGQEEFVKFAKWLGEPVVNSRTDYNGIFEVGVGKTPFVDEDVNETGFAEKHTDGLTFVSNPDISLLRCVSSDSCNRGYNRVYDAKQLMINLANSSDLFFKALTMPIIEKFDGKTFRPILQISDRLGQAKFFFNQDNVPNTGVYRTISHYINELPFKRILLKSGDILVMNNARVLHARESFADTNRHMQRIIIDLKDNSSQPLNCGFRFSQNLHEESHT